MTKITPHEQFSDEQAEEQRMRPEVLDPPTSRLCTAIKAFAIAMTALFILFATITVGYAQELPPNCGPEDKVTTELFEAGFKPLFVGVDGNNENVAVVVWLNEETGVWMLHTLNTLLGINCHASGGYDYVVQMPGVPA